MSEENITPPNKLYRFRSINNLGRVIQEISCLHWFSTAENLNDPFDGISGLPEESVDEVRPFIGRLENNDKKNLYSAHVTGNKKWMVACFTGEWNSTSMWAHYAACGSGVCLVYDPSIIVKRLHENQKHPIIGTQEKPLFKSVNYVKSLPIESIDIEERIFSKAKSWEYEGEWRAALLGLEQLDNKGGMMVNLHGAITQVLIGWKVGPEAYTPIIDAVNKLRKRGENIKVGIVIVTPSTKELEIQWPWDNLHLPLPLPLGV